MNDLRQGFTLIEVLVGMVVLVLGLFALSSLQTASIGSHASSQQMTIATMLAQDKIEELKVLQKTDAQLKDTENNFVDLTGDGVPDYFDWNLTPDHLNEDGPTGMANPIDANGNSVTSGGYERVWNVVDNFPIRGMKIISVRVSWHFQGYHQVTVDCII